MLQFSNFGRVRVMEPETISKNGASSKSQTSRGNFLIKSAIIFIMAICFLPAFAQKPEKKCEIIRFSAFYSTASPKKTTLVESAKDCVYTIEWDADEYPLESPFFAYIIYTDENGKKQEYTSVTNSERIKPKAGSKIETYAYTTLASQPIKCFVCSICAN